MPAVWFLVTGLGWYTFSPIFTMSGHGLSVGRAIYFLLAVVVAVILTGRSQHPKWTLKQIIGWRGKPLAIRCDNGPEYLNAAIVEWSRTWGIKLEYIQPGKPQQNAYVERFNRTVRYEWLSQYHWDDLDHLQRVATQWMWSYNHERPNMALGGFTPKQRLAMAAKRSYFCQTLKMGDYPGRHRSPFPASRTSSSSCRVQFRYRNVAHAPDIPLPAR